MDIISYFADDTVVLFSNSDFHKLKEKIVIGVNLINNWFDSIELNFSKSYFIYFKISNTQ